MRARSGTRSGTCHNLQMKVSSMFARRIKNIIKIIFAASQCSRPAAAANDGGHGGGSTPPPEAPKGGKAETADEPLSGWGAAPRGLRRGRHPSDQIQSNQRPQGGTKGSNPPQGHKNANARAAAGGTRAATPLSAGKNTKTDQSGVYGLVATPAGQQSSGNRS